MSSASSPDPSTPAPQQVVIQQQQSALGRYGKYVLMMLIFCVMALIGLQARYESYFSKPGDPQEKYHSLSKEALEKIAVIGVSGTIVEGNDFVKKQIDQVKKDKDVVAVVVRIDSPGGTVTHSDYLYHHLRELTNQEDRELPMVVSMRSMAAAGTYTRASAVGVKLFFFFFFEVDGAQISVNVCSSFR